MRFEDTYNLKDKVAVVTGGTGVLGSRMVLTIGECGGKVAVLGHTEKHIKSTSRKLDKEGIEYLMLKIDVLNKDSLKRAREKVLNKYGKVDILINGAGGNRPEATTGPDQSFFELPEEAVKFVFNLNFLGTFLSSQVFGEILAEQKEGVILNISSMNAFTPLTKIPAYSAAKAAVSNFTRWLAVHMSQNYSPDIRVNAIAPGFLLTEQNRYLLIDEETGDLTERGRKIIDHTPMGRFGDPEDLLATVLWLITPGSEFVHGVVVPIDGGFSAFSGV